MKGFTNKRIAACVLGILLLGTILIYPSIAHASTAATTTQKAAAKTVTVKFMANGGVVSTRTYTVGNKYAALPSAPNKTNFTFVGWYTSGTGGTRIKTDTIVSASYTTLYARYQGKSSEVTFNSNGGSSVGKRTVYYSSQYGKIGRAHV